MYQNFGVLHLVVTGLLGWLIGGEFGGGKKIWERKPVGVLCFFVKIASTLIFECFFFGSDL